MKAMIAAGILLLSSAALSANLAPADKWRLRPQVGIGYTDNANFESENKNADLFWWARSSNTKLDGDSSLNLWLSFKDFMNEHQNDVFGYRLGKSQEVIGSGIGAFEWDWAFGGQQFLQGSPATTEESFDHVYAETSGTKIRTLRNNLELIFETLYQVKYYPKFEGRTDHSLLLNSELSWNLSAIQTLSPYLEAGLTASSQSLYSKNYFEVGSEWRIISTAEPDICWTVIV